MAVNNFEPIPYYVVPPGEILKAEIRERKIRQKTMAEQIGMRPSHFSELLKGKRSITKYIAVKLESILGISASEWLRLQAQYDYEVAVRELNYDPEYIGSVEPQLSLGILNDSGEEAEESDGYRAYHLGYSFGKEAERKRILSLLNEAGIDLKGLEI